MNDERQFADDVRLECRQCCREFVSVNPYDVMTGDYRTHGPFCTRRCLDHFCAMYSGARMKERTDAV